MPRPQNIFNFCGNVKPITEVHVFFYTPYTKGETIYLCTTEMNPSSDSKIFKKISEKRGHMLIYLIPTNLKLGKLELSREKNTKFYVIVQQICLLAWEIGAERTEREFLEVRDI